MQIRAATEADIAEIQSIYAHHVLTGAGTFEEVPPSVEEISDRVARVLQRGWSWLVATDATGVLGYAYYTQFRDRSAYRFCAEDSVYVREDVRGQGVGKALVARLIDDATAAGMRQMIAVIGDFRKHRLDRRACQPWFPHGGHHAGSRHQVWPLGGCRHYAASTRQGRRRYPLNSSPSPCGRGAVGGDNPAVTLPLPSWPPTASSPACLCRSLASPCDCGCPKVAFRSP